MISLGTWYFCYMRYFLLKYYVCALLWLYEFKQLVMKMKLTTILVLRITEIVNIVFLNILYAWDSTSTKA